MTYIHGSAETREDYRFESAMVDVRFHREVADIHLRYATGGSAIGFAERDQEIALAICARDSARARCFKGYQDVSRAELAVAA